MAKLDEKVFLAALAERFADYVPANTVKAILSDIRAELENYQLVTVIPGTPAADETEDLVKLWLNAKTVEGLSAKSIEQYEYCLGRIRQDIGVPGKPAPAPPHAGSDLPRQRNEPGRGSGYSWA